MGNSAQGQNELRRRSGNNLPPQQQIPPQREIPPPNLPPLQREIPPPQREIPPLNTTASLPLNSARNQGLQRTSRQQSGGFISDLGLPLGNRGIAAGMGTISNVPNRQQQQRDRVPPRSPRMPPYNRGVY